MLLEGTTAIVSGVGPGLGQAIATAFVREGANVTLAARNEEYLDGVATELRSNGGRVLVSPTNITDAAACSRTVERTVTEFGGIDAVVNNAFRMDPGYAFADADLERWKKIYEVNVWGSLNMTQAVIPSMRARGHGSIHGGRSAVRVGLPCDPVLRHPSRQSATADDPANRRPPA